MRSLTPKFRSDLKEGILSPITKAVISDTSLCLELRGEYVDVYYRGGKLAGVRAKPTTGTYSVCFDNNYFKHGKSVELPKAHIEVKEDIVRWLDIWPNLKQAIDHHISAEGKEEREVQQRILRDNNFSNIARSTDFYICDIEYRSEYGQFDMVAMHWPSTPRDRQNPYNRRLVFIEVKNGDNALTEDAGLHKHIGDINNFVKEHKTLQTFKEDMVNVFNQKLELGLIDCGKDVASFGDDRPRFLLALVNHDPGSSILRRELDTLPESPHVELCIATASFLGYGLYDQGIHPIDEARKYLGPYIYHKETGWLR